MNLGAKVKRAMSYIPALMPALITILSWELMPKGDVGVMTAIKMRRSIRHYKNKTVDKEKLDKVLEAGRLAPSAGNLQEWKFVVVSDKSTKEKLAMAANSRSVKEAPMIIVACATITDCILGSGQLTYPIDVAIAVNHIALKAVEEGLGTCWIGSFNEEVVKKILSIPDNIRIVTLLTIGYPKYVPGPRKRKKMEEIVVYEKWTYVKDTDEH
jgi:nitroreductase